MPMADMRVTLDQSRAFETVVARSGSFSSAAIVLFVTQPAKESEAMAGSPQ